jgi:hypothetical protein
VPKTEKAYGQVSRRLLALRRSGVVPYEEITDRSRWTMAPRTRSNLDAMLADVAVSYRRALWHDRPACVEILSEKDAITGTIAGICNECHVPLGITRGG